MIVGPPGTGKTDVAVQVIVNLYHAHPTQKILIVAHSNAALNDLFEKIMMVCFLFYLSTSRNDLSVFSVTWLPAICCGWVVGKQISVEKRVAALVATQTERFSVSRVV